MLRGFSTYFTSCVLVITCSLCTFVTAVQGQNPFEIKKKPTSVTQKITPRPQTATTPIAPKSTTLATKPATTSTTLSTTPATSTPVASIPKDSTSTVVAKKNPFDIVRVAPQKIVATNSPQPITKETKSENTPNSITTTESGKPQNFLFVIVLSVLIFLTLMLTLSRILVSKIWQGFLNDNMFRLLHRERSALNTTAYTILYVMFLINVAVLVFLYLQSKNLLIGGTEWQTLLLCLGGVGLGFGLKHLVLWYMSSILPIWKDVDLYHFIIVLFGIIAGLFLAPLNVFIAYADASMLPFYFGIAGVILGIIYVYRCVRSLLIGQKYLISNTFHFFIYVFVVELIPILAILKLSF